MASCRPSPLLVLRGGIEITYDTQMDNRNTFTQQELENTAKKILDLYFDTSSPSFKKEAILNRININNRDYNSFQEKIDRLKQMQKDLLDENNKLIEEYGSIDGEAENLVLI